MRFFNLAAFRSVSRAEGIVEDFAATSMILDDFAANRRFPNLLEKQFENCSSFDQQEPVFDPRLVEAGKERGHEMLVINHKRAT